MCGFAGVITFGGRPVDGNVVARMGRTLEHRGPDDDGLFLAGGVGLAFRRLSILDLSPSGHQPLTSASGRLTIVFNGEIYNYIELREELRALGHVFRSSGDTEVLLHAYEEWGRECLPRLNGMWAFLIHDAATGTVFGSRDRFGVKPLYRHRTADALYMASEIKAIRASGAYQWSTNWTAAGELLCRAGHVPGNDVNGTFYVGIDQVAPGTAFEVDGRGTMREWRYWSLGDIAEQRIDDPVAETARLFEDAVRLRMRSDVPVGVSLSGGLDSTSIAAVMARLRGDDRKDRPDESLQAFSYIAPEYDESSYIQDTVGQSRALLHRVHTDAATLWSSLDQVLWYHDEPLHSATALVGFEIYRAARANGVKVMLSGQGADETMAGYPVYFADYWSTLLRGGSPAEAWREIARHHAVHGGSPAKTLRQVATRTVRNALRSIPLYRTAAAARHRQRARAAHDWFRPEIVDALPPEDAGYGDGCLSTALRLSVERSPLPLYLRIEDRNSMAHSVEARLPFLDYRLVTLMFQLPAHWKMRGAQGKHVMREAMRGLIPESVRSRVDKMGFPTPLADWFRAGLYEPMQDTLASQAVRERGIYNIDAIRRDLERHRRGETDAALGLFNVAQFERWMAIGETQPSSVSPGPAARVAAERAIAVA